jgi:hypothetical protein
MVLLYDGTRYEIRGIKSEEYERNMKLYQIITNVCALHKPSEPSLCANATRLTHSTTPVVRVVTGGGGDDLTTQLGYVKQHIEYINKLIAYINYDNTPNIESMRDDNMINVLIQLKKYFDTLEQVEILSTLPDEYLDMYTKIDDLVNDEAYATILHNHASLL